MPRYWPILPKGDKGLDGLIFAASSHSTSFLIVAHDVNSNTNNKESWFCEKYYTVFHCFGSFSTNPELLSIQQIMGSDFCH